MMENAKKMRERHTRELVNLQEACLHENISDWMPYYWAPAHSCGQVKICNVCEKIIEKDDAFKAMTEPADFSISQSKQSSVGGVK